MESTKESERARKRESTNESKRAIEGEERHC
jgi:hypothetical protein